MLSILIDEISYSRLQYLFEYAISIAIDEYPRQHKLWLKFSVAKQLRHKLIWKDMNLYIFLNAGWKAEFANIYII